MASEIRVNTINSRTGFGTITVSETGQDLVGITTIATLSVTGNATVGGVLTYEDVTNVDSIGIITARSDLKVGGDIELTGTGNVAIPNDTGKFTVGASEDLQLFHDGGSSIIRNTNNSAALYLQGSSSGTVNVKCVANGSTQLWHNGAVVAYTEAAKLRLNDSVQLEIGSSSDLKLWHSGTDSFIRNETGNLKIQANGAGDDAIKIVSDGSVELSYNDVKKLSTEDYGVKIHDAILEIADTSCLIDLMETGGATKHRIRNGSGNFYVQKISDDKSTTTDQLVIDGGTGSTALYHSGTKKLSTTANGICFNSDSAAANALDDYEEGDWTPTIAFSGGTTGITYHATTNGRYTKIGRAVNIRAYIMLTSKGSDTGNLTMHGLPFNSANVSGGYTVIASWHTSMEIPGQGNILTYVDNNGTTIRCHYFNTSNGDANNVTNSYVNNNTEIMIQGTYYVTA